MPEKSEQQKITRKNSTPIKVWLLPDEKQLIEKKANQHGLSLSAYLRQIGLGLPVKSTVDKAAIGQLAKISADLGRFGGLLKMWLSNDERLKRFGRDKSARLVLEALNEIKVLQAALFEKVKTL